MQTSCVTFSCLEVTIFPCSLEFCVYVYMCPLCPGMDRYMLVLGYMRGNLFVYLSAYHRSDGPKLGYSVKDTLNH